MATPQYLTTRELADLLRIKERKVYDLAASGTIPHTKAMGKLLFSRLEVEAWLAHHASGKAAPIARPPVFLGSHDPLLDRALRLSRCGIAGLFDGSLDGLDRFAAREGIAAGLHIHEESGAWNTGAISQRFANEPVVLVEWARRQRGLIYQASGAAPERFADIAGRRLMMRQEGAGSQMLLRHLIASHGLGDQDVIRAGLAGTESEAALSVLEGKADLAFGLEAIARQHRLEFLPVIEERYDLLVDRKAWFEPPMQAFLDYCRSVDFAERAAELEGYDVSRLGQVHYLGA